MGVVIVVATEQALAVFISSTELPALCTPLYSELFSLENDLPPI